VVPNVVQHEAQVRRANDVVPRPAPVQRSDTIVQPSSTSNATASLLAVAGIRG
jgi:hypothetical protein